MKQFIAFLTMTFFVILLILSPISLLSQGPEKLIINDQEYFEIPGLNVMVYHDYYAIGHQSGVTIIQNGERVAANGDIRLTPNQRPQPQNGKRTVDRDNNEISVDVYYADSLRQKYL